MKNPLRIAIATVALLAAGAALNAQPGLNVATVDVQVLMEKYYKAEASTAKLREDEKKAKVDIDGMVTQRDEIVKQANELQEQAKNTILTEDARKRAEGELQKKVEELQAQEGKIQNFIQSAKRTLQERAGRDQQMYFEEINKVIAETAKKKGATLVLNKAAVALVLYVDSSYDLTNDVLAVINKDAPTPSITINSSK